MTPRFRHCIECCKCGTRYLIPASPYANGSYVVSPAPFSSDEYTLYCACSKPPASSQWRWSELKIYQISRLAFERGYGSRDEIVASVQTQSKSQGFNSTIFTATTREKTENFE